MRRPVEWPAMVGVLIVIQNVFFVDILFAGHFLVATCRISVIAGGDQLGNKVYGRCQKSATPSIVNVLRAD
jgi:hypothetical protein